MRIADHAVAMQSSQALQQPARVADQQQAAVPVTAEQEAAEEARTRAAHVPEQNKTEGRIMEPRQGGGNARKENTNRKKGNETKHPLGSEEDDRSVGPDEEGHLDILV